MTRGQAYSVTLRIQNTSIRAWPIGGTNPVRLSYHWKFNDGSCCVVWDGLHTSLPEAPSFYNAPAGQIPPGAAVTVNASVQAPNSPGTYLLEWDLVQEGVSWFNLAGGSWPTVLVTVQVQ